MPALTFTADNTTDQLTITGHGLTTGDGAALVRNTSGGTLPGGLAAVTEYWIVRIDANTIKLATSAANALATTPVTVDITSNGSGTNILEIGIPYRRAQTFVNGVSVIDESDLNGMQDALAALHLLVTGQAGTIWTKVGHGTKTLPIPAEAFVPDGGNADAYGHGRTNSGVGNNSGTAVAFRAPISLPAGKRVTAVRLLIRDNATGTTTAAFSVVRLVASTNTPTTLVTSSTSAGDGSFQTLTASLAETVTSGNFMSIRVSGVTGTSTVTIHGAEVDYDELL